MSGECKRDGSVAVKVVHVSLPPGFDSRKCTLMSRTPPPCNSASFHGPGVALKLVNGSSVLLGGLLRNISVSEPAEWGAASEGPR